MIIEVTGLLSLLWLVAVVYALIQVVQSHATTGAKVAWTVFVLLFPILGVIVWFFLGPREAKA